MHNKETGSEKSLFYRYVIPSIGAMLVTSLYVVVDGIFVGRGISANALAAINIAGPYIMVIVAVSMMITVGGATMTAISIGRGEKEKADLYFTGSMKILLVFSGIMTFISVLFPEKIARLLGASDVLLEDTACYIRFFVLFGVFFCSAMALAAFVRNDGAPRLAFWGMVLGGVSNIFLDWLFIFPLGMGITGPAIASGLGQTLSCVLMISHFIRGKGQLRLSHEKLSKDVVSEIIKRGTPELMNQLFQPVTVFCYNLIAIRVYGETGVAAFSVVYYVLTITVSVFVGLTQGIQPLIGRSFGEEDTESEMYFYHKGIKLNIMLAVIVYAGMFVFGSRVVSMFNRDPELITIACECLRIYGISFILTAVNVVVITYFTATKRTAKALFISVLRCLVFIPLFIFIMPALLGEKAVWSGIIIAEAVSLISVYFIRGKSYEVKRNDVTVPGI